VVSDAVRTVHAKAEAASPATLREVYAALCAELGDWLARHGADAASSSFGLAADMRYIGQSYEIAVPLEPAWLASDGLPRILAAFHRAHERAFGHADPEAPAEIVNLRVQLRAARPRVPLAEAPATTEPATPRTTRPLWLDGRRTHARVYEREGLGRGMRLAGPAIVEQPDTTVLIPEGHVAEVDRFGNLLLRRER
jgi:N-methylhydantoinase A